MDKAKQSNTRKCPLKWTSNNRVSTKVDSYHIIKYVFVPCPSRSSSIRLNDYSARAQNMCNAHIFKLLIMFRTRNMCSAHSLRLHICACLRLLYAVPFLRTLVLFLTVGFAYASPAQQRKIPVLWNLQWRNFLIKRSKTTLLRALPIKLAVQVFRMSEASRTNEAEKVEFSRLSIIRLKAYSARKEGKTEPQASRACEWLGVPLKRHRNMP